MDSSLGSERRAEPGRGGNLAKIDREFEGGDRKDTFPPPARSMMPKESAQ